MNNHTLLCNDIWMHIFQFLDYDTLFKSVASVSSFSHQLCLEGLLRHVEHQGEVYVNWFMSYTASRYVNTPVSTSTSSQEEREQLILKTRELNYDCLRKTYAQFSDWKLFMDQLCNTLAPRLLFKCAKWNQQQQQHQLARTLLIRVLDLIFALDHLKMLQCHVSNDLSMFRRVCSVMRKDNDYSEEWLNIMSIMRTEFYFSKKSLFSGISEAKSSEFISMLQQFNGSMQEEQQQNKKNDEEERFRRIRVGLMLLGVMETRRASTRQLKHQLNFLGKQLPKCSRSTTRKVPLLSQAQFPNVVYSPSFFISKCASQTEQLYHKIK